MQLDEFQKRFKDIMLDHPDALLDLDEEFAATFNTGNIVLPERLMVYRNNIVGGLTDILIASFPIIEKLVGHDFLEGMGRNYVLKNPPDTGCLSRYGQEFDEFIKQFELAKGLPYLPDVASLEIAMNDAYYAADDKALTPEGLAVVPPEELENTQISLRSSVTLISSIYPLDNIKKFCLKQDRGDDETLDLNMGGVKLMVYRPGIEVQLIKLQDDEFLALEIFCDNMDLEGVVQKTLEEFEGFDFQKFLARHMELETFSDFYTNW